MAKSKIIQDDENVTVTVLNAEDDTKNPVDESSVSISVHNVEKIKAIIQFDNSAKFYKESASSLKKALVEEMKVSSSFVSELISIVRKEMDPESEDSVIEQKTKVLDAAQQAVVLYPNVVVKESTIAAGKNGGDSNN